jgi:hypothetical protein
MDRFREWCWADEENECSICGQTKTEFDCDNCEEE